MDWPGEKNKILENLRVNTQRFITNRSKGQKRSEKRKRESNKEAEDNHGERTEEGKEDEEADDQVHTYTTTSKARPVENSAFFSGVPFCGRPTATCETSSIVARKERVTNLLVCFDVQ